jgi:starvation-inducible DNA-binding protein
MTVKIDVGLSIEERRAVAGALSQVLGDSYALYLKTHGYHWNVRGPTFQSLHILFEGQYQEEWAALDVLAERIRSVGELVPQGYAAFGNLTTIKDGDSAKDADAMVAELMDDNQTVLATIRDAFRVAESVGDEATMDLLNARTAAHAKHAWMLRATLGSE